MVASGVWATPAGDAKGDIPEKLTLPDVYDRIVHNLFSINMVWTLIAGFLVMFMQAGFMLVETGLCRAKNCGPHRRHEFDGLSARLHRILGLWIRDWLGQLVEWPSAARLVSHRSGLGLSLLNEGWHWSRRPIRRHQAFSPTADGHQGLFPPRQSMTSASWRCFSS